MPEAAMTQRNSSLLVAALLLPGLLLFSTAARPQDEGGADVEAEVSMEVEGDELDFSGAETEVFDIDEYTQQESTLQVSTQAGQAKGIGKIHDAAKAKSSISLTEEGSMIMAPVVPDYYVVQKGDTLFYLSEYFFGDPEMWPGIWSLNPEITNPNWIYPGQSLLVSPTKQAVEGGAGGGPGEEPYASVLPQMAFWKEGTQYVRPLGFIDKDIEEETGKIIGSDEETQYLDMFHNVYVKYKKGKAPMVGTKSTVYEVVGKVNDDEKRKIKYGKLVRILGQVKITAVDDDHHLAEAQIVDAVRPIERNDLIGPIDYTFETKEPVKGKLDLEGKIIAPLEDVEYSGQFDIVFVNLGKEDGVLDGNVFKVLRKRDPLMESFNKKDKSKYFPWEEIGKVMVIETLKKTATCLVTYSSRDLRVGDKVELKRGE
jgi:hypothetical protein